MKWIIKLTLMKPDALVIWSSKNYTSYMVLHKSSKNTRPWPLSRPTYLWSNPFQILTMLHIKKTAASQCHQCPKRYCPTWVASAVPYTILPHTDFTVKVGLCSFVKLKLCLPEVVNKKGVIHFYKNQVISTSDWLFLNFLLFLSWDVLNLFLILFFYKALFWHRVVFISYQH